MRISTITLGGLLLASAAPSMAQDTAPPPPVKLSGGVTLTSDYRFRGLTQTDGNGAAQATLNLNSSSGFYVGTFVSTIDGGDDGSTPALTGYGDAEVDLYGGYTRGFGGLTFDGGLLYYYYPGGDKHLNTDFFEPYASLSYTIGPVSTKLGANYAWGGQKGLDFTSGNDDNIYGYGEASVAIPSTPVTLKGHLGYTKGSLGLVNPGDKDSYWDWSLTAEAVGGPFKVGASYIDTNVTDAYDPDLGGRFDRKLGRGSTVLAYVGYSF